ncbi:hypothetical protein QT972_20625 [Microcoleus sp. herbarium7]|uniref:hypothetical protein n=1 Tax=Microcoleus sp. herbarium7 TaxID=3055435 RepID=UPI002FD237DD
MNDSRPALKKIIANLILTNKSRLSDVRSGQWERSGVRLERLTAGLLEYKKTRACLPYQFRLHRNDKRGHGTAVSLHDRL